MNISPKDHLLFLTAPIPRPVLWAREQLPEEKVEKVERIASILTANPELCRDPQVLKRLLTYTEKEKDPRIIGLRRGLIQGCCCDEKEGIAVITKNALVPDSETEALIPTVPKTMGCLAGGKLIISEKALEKLGKDQFWNVIKDHAVGTLIILPENGAPIIYETHILLQLAEMRLSLEYLTQKMTLQFAAGEITETKAKLLLCGEYFEGLFQSGMKETESKIKFGFTEVEDKEGKIIESYSHVSINGFRKILQAVETGECSSEDLDFVNAAQYLRFSLATNIPEGFIGKAEWEKYYGAVGEVPPPPIELINAWKGPCPIFKGIFNRKKFCDTHVVVYVPSTIDGKPLTINAMRELVKKPKSGGNAIRQSSLGKISKEIGNRPVKGGYWLAMLKKPIPETEEKLFAEQQAYIQKHCGGYVVPSTIDMIVGISMHYVCSGAKQERLFDRDSLTYTRCAEKVGDLQVVVGRFDLWGLYVDRDFDGDGRDVVGVAPARKFC